jgi:phage-related protein
VKTKRPAQKPCIFIGSSLKDLRRFPAKVKNRVGFALNAVQEGGEPIAAKALRGFGGRTVLELVEDFDSDTYRAVYTVSLLALCTCFMPSRRRRRKASPHHSRTSN